MQKTATQLIFLIKKLRWQVNLILIMICFATFLFIWAIPIKKQSLQRIQEQFHMADKEDPEIHYKKNDFRTKFYAELPSTAQLKEMEAYFFELAAVKHLGADSVDYQLDEQQDIPFAVYKMQAPVSGTYLEVMGFIQKMLETYPTVALTDFSIWREDAKTNQVNSDIQFSVFIKKND